MLKIISLITGRKIIWLEDMDGETYRTLLKTTPFGNKAHVYWLTRTGFVNLNDDGTCTGLSSYIKKWKYA